MVLIGNSFPLTLVRRRVEITPAAVEELRSKIQKEGFISFWGHENTRAAATLILGIDPAPLTSRPMLTLSKDGLPEIDGRTFDEVWVLSPNSASRHLPGKELDAAEVTTWTVLRLYFPAR